MNSSIETAGFIVPDQASSFFQALSDLMGEYGLSLLLLFCVSFVVAFTIVVTAHAGLLSRFTHRTDSDIQAQHVGAVPRLGGISLIIASLLIPIFGLGSAAWAEHNYLMICALPVLWMAVMEDVGRSVDPVYRLAGSFAAAAIFIIVSSNSVPRTGIELIDTFFTYKAITFLISVFIVAAATQAMNLIDGLNGLCAGIALFIFISLFGVAAASGQKDLLILPAAIVPVIVGFLCLNYPVGRLFLGDSGAYLLGFYASALAIYFLRKIELLSPAAVLLIFFWPVFDLTLTVFRRALRGRPLFMPDKMHPHHVIVRLLRAYFPHGPLQRMANPLAATLLLALAALPMSLGVALWDQNDLAWAVLCISMVAYAGLYVWIVRYAHRVWRRLHLGAKQSIGDRAGARISILRDAALSVCPSIPVDGSAVTLRESHDG